MYCPNCTAFVIDTVETSTERVYRDGYAPRYRSTYRLFPCGHSLAVEDSIWPSYRTG